MAKFLPMAPDSAGFKVLMRLRELGGRATQAELIPLMWGDFKNPRRFKQVALEPLIERGLVTASSRLVTITVEGRLFADRNFAVITQPREQPNMTSTLNLQKYGRRPESRPGAYDYREAPSIMSGERVPYHHSNSPKRDGDEGSNG